MPTKPLPWIYTGQYGCCREWSCAAFVHLKEGSAGPEDANEAKTRACNNVASHSLRIL